MQFKSSDLFNNKINNFSPSPSKEKIRNGKIHLYTIIYIFLNRKRQDFFKTKV